MISPASAVAFCVGSYSVRFYSLIMLGAIIAGSFTICFVAKKYYRGVSIEKILDILPVIVICAIFGARLYYVALDWGYYSKHLLEVFAFNQGGLSIHGAILGGFLSGYFCVKHYKLNLWRYADVFAYGLPIGQAIGRLGNYFNIEAFGKPCFFSDWICMYVPKVKRPFEYMDYEYFHPTFLYEIIWNIIVFLLLFFVVKKNVKNYDGVLFFVYLILYSVGRFLIEGIRLDSVLSINGIHIAEIVSFIVIIFSVIMILKRVKDTKRITML